MQIQFLRHAAFILTYHDVRILVDPMLSPAGAMDPVANAANQQRIPLVDLPLTPGELRESLDQLDLVLVTHVHRDHWDTTAVELLPKSVPILCQPGDETPISAAGFTDVTPVESFVKGLGFSLSRTRGLHGTGEIGQRMGSVSGFVLQEPDEPTLYIAGDTIWCGAVQSALQTYRPDVVVVNAGAAQFLTGDPITMTADDVCRVCREWPSARVVAVHMEAVNHCGLTRAALRSRLVEEALDARVQIPADGAILSF